MKEREMPDVADHAQLVYDELKEAQGNKPDDPKGRYRLYECRSPQGRVCYVWERNPTMALGRAAPCFGIVAEVVDRKITSDHIKTALAAMSEEDRAALIAELGGAPTKVDKPRRGR